MTLSRLVDWVQEVPGSLPEEMRPMAASICEAFGSTAKRLIDLGLGYLTLDRSASTLSTGERQRMQLARAVRNRRQQLLFCHWRSATAPPGSCMCWTSRPSACIRPIL